MTEGCVAKAFDERIQAAIKAAENALDGGLSLADAVCAALYVAGQGSVHPDREAREPWAWAADFTAVGSGLLITREPDVAAVWKQAALETEKALGKKCTVIPLYASVSS